ncbi:MAG: carboxypeptidase regulatory-like domain-containing protein, partial [Bacteroidota bacterium]
MKFTVLISLVLFTFSTLLLAQKAPGSFKLTGTVTDESSGKGLLSATVSVLSRNGSKTIAGSTSDEKGNFTVENIPQNNVRVRLSMLGYQTVVIDSVDLEQSSRLGLVKLKSS